MKIMIDIPEKVYRGIQKRSTEIQAEGLILENAVLNGKPLPKRSAKEQSIYDLCEQLANGIVEAIK